MGENCHIWQANSDKLIEKIARIQGGGSPTMSDLSVFIRKAVAVLTCDGRIIVVGFFLDT